MQTSDKRNKPLVSIIIPTYKGSDKLSRALDSCINQTYENIEVIVVDDNEPSTPEREKTTELLNGYLDNCSYVKYICHEKNRNGAVARNTGIKIAKGKYVTFLDDDDYMFDKRIEHSLHQLLKSKDCGACLCNVLIFLKNQFVSYHISDCTLSVDEYIINSDPLGTGSNLFLELSLAQELEGFDESFTRHQDWEFFIRLCEKTKLTHVDEFLIIKGTNNVDNCTNYVNYENMKLKYFKKFDYIISNLSQDQNHQFYKLHYGMLFNNALKLGINEFIDKASANLRTIDEYGIVHRVTAFLAKAKFISSPFGRWLRCVFKVIKGRCYLLTLKNTGELGGVDDNIAKFTNY